MLGVTYSTPFVFEASIFLTWIAYAYSNEAVRTTERGAIAARADSLLPSKEYLVK